MGELDENEMTPATNGASTPTNDEPKETEDLLIKKAETKTSSDIKKPSETPKSPSTVTAEIETPPADTINVNIASVITSPDTKTNGAAEEIINIPEATSTPKNNLVAGEGREVKPKKIPIGGIKMPGFFTKTKPKAEGDGADGELLEKDENEEKSPGEAVTETLTKPAEKPARSSFFSALRFRNPFARREPAAAAVIKDEEDKETAVNGKLLSYKVK